MKKIFFFSLISLMAILNMACSNDNPEPQPTGIVPTVQVQLPDSLQGKLINETFEIKNVSTGKMETITGRDKLTLIAGLYDVAYEADVQATTGDLTHVKAFTQSIEIKDNQSVMQFNAFRSISNSDFVISEIYFTGSLTPAGKQYLGDSYFKIYNNTDHVLYADGLSIVESTFLTTAKYNYSPDIMDQAMSVEAIYTIPGSGKDYPVQPGEELLIVDNGIDHRIANPNSIDLSKANFEWFDESSVASVQDIDAPSVPNLDKWYCYTKSIWIPHNRGFKSYAIARIPVAKDAYLKDYLYTYKYDIVTASGTYPMERQTYKVMNDWIVDAVNCSVPSEFQWIITSPAIDRGWTYCGQVRSDKTRYFHSVRRKVLYLRDGKPVLQDTNNSSVDFNPYQTPSVVELQGASIDAAGTKATTMTWDGVMPRK